MGEVVDAREAFAKTQLPISIRPMVKGDEPFLYATWLNCYRESSPYTKGIPKDIFYDNHKMIIAKILQNSEISIACDAEDACVIYGFLVASGVDTIHFIYVKAPFRGYGIAKALMSIKLWKEPFQCSHWTDAASVYSMEHGAKGVRIFYNPYIGLGD